MTMIIKNLLINNTNSYKKYITTQFLLRWGIIGGTAAIITIFNLIFLFLFLTKSDDVIILFGVDLFLAAVGCIFLCIFVEDPCDYENKSDILEKEYDKAVKRYEKDYKDFINS